MEFGVHLPLLVFRGQAFSLSRLVDYAEAAQQLGFTTLCANDHLTFSRPWLDSLTALASLLTKTPHMTLMTTVALPVVRGPVPLAKSLAAPSCSTSRYTTSRPISSAIAAAMTSGVACSKSIQRPAW